MLHMLLASGCGQNVLGVRWDAVMNCEGRHLAYVWTFQVQAQLNRLCCICNESDAVISSCIGCALYNSKF